MRIAPHGVVPGQFAQLLALYEEDDLTQRELCDRIRIEQATMANTLQRPPPPVRSIRLDNPRASS
ncbi:MAG TPA: helix-turn-helix domain-containing protein [Actinomycetes bacterium]